MTVTDTEFPIAREVFGKCGELAEVDDYGVYTSRRFHDFDTLPFVLVRATDRGNLPVGPDVAEWMRLFRPQAFVVVGTAGGVWRPADPDRRVWKGTPRGDVVVSEFVHYGDYRKVTSEGNLVRYHRLEQPSTALLLQARALIDNPRSWQQWLGERWDSAGRRPMASEQEFLVGEQIQDDPLDATQQFLMRTFDRAAAAEMESAGVAQTLHSLRRGATYAPMYLSVRGVSDLIWACGVDGELSDEDVARAEAFYAEKQRDEGADGSAAHDKSSERALWSPRAAEAASAFALALVQRLVRRPMGIMLGHPAIPAHQLTAVGADV